MMSKCKELKRGDRLIVLESGESPYCNDGDTIVFVSYHNNRKSLIAVNVTHSHKGFGNHECLYGKELCIDIDNVMQVGDR